MTLTRWTLGLALAATTLLSACGGGSSSNTNIRLLNAAALYANPLELQIGTGTPNTAVSYGNVNANYMSGGTSSTTYNILDSTTGNTVLPLTMSLSGSTGPYTLVVYNYQGNLASTVVNENLATPASGQSAIQILNTVPAKVSGSTAGGLDVYIAPAGVSGTTPITVSGRSVSQASTVTSGTFNITVTAQNQPSSVYLTLTGVALASQTNYTLVLTTSTSGVLVNGILLTQQNGTTAYANGNARVRMVNALTGTSANTTTAALTGTVTTGSSTSTLMSGSTVQNIGSYSVLTAGTPTFNVTTGTGATIPVTSSVSTLSAGSDYTLLVSGDGTAANSVAKLIFDNNSAPVSGYSNFRLVNGMTGTAGALLSVNSQVLATGVAYGSASSPASLASTTYASALLVTDQNLSSNPCSAYSPLASVPGNQVVSVFLAGSVAKPVCLSPYVEP
ncbi:MAG: DUF4397 domain-containing protein [Curvibacter sp.]|nr:DUF4397 domain-containing protein [Curvibacter sp.]